MIRYGFEGNDLRGKRVIPITGTLHIEEIGDIYPVHGYLYTRNDTETLTGRFYTHGLDAIIEVAAIEKPSVSYNLFRLSNMRFLHAIRAQSKTAQSLHSLLFKGHRYHCMEGVKPDILKDWNQATERYKKHTDTEIRLHFI